MASGYVCATGVPLPMFVRRKQGNRQTGDGWMNCVETSMEYLLGPDGKKVKMDVYVWRSGCLHSQRQSELFSASSRHRRL